MIKDFSIRGFKSIESADLAFGNVNVLIGANGSGKSNILEAVGAIAAAAFGRVDSESLMRRGCRAAGIIEPMFKGTARYANTELTAANSQSKYSVELSHPEPSAPKGWEFTREFLAVGNRPIVDRSNFETQVRGDPQAGLAALKLAEIDTNDPAAIFLKTLSNYSIYTPETAVLRGTMQDPQLREPIGLYGGRLNSAVLEVWNDPALRTKLHDAIRTTVDWLEFFSAVNLRPANAKSDDKGTLLFLDRYFREVNGGRYFLLTSDVSEGALYFLFVAILCLHPAAPKFFALDNADHGLNPILARKLMTIVCNWLLEQNSERQVLMTTHNPLALDGLPLNDERVRLFIVDRDNRGATNIKRFEITDKHRSLAADGWTLSRMWVNGLIGGVPNV